MSKNIVILGAGFGGLRCALNIEAELRRYLRGTTPEAEDWRIVLVDRNAYHIYYPRLYELAVSQETSCTLEIKDILKISNIEFIQGEITSIDCKERKVEVTPSGSPLHKGEKIEFEYLVLALGAGTDYFGIEGLEKYACTLKSVEDAEVIRERVGEFLKYSEALPPRSRSGRQGLPFSIMIGGAGATGVEVAAELAYVFRNVPREKWSVTLVEALSTVLWMFPPEMGKYAYQRLTKLGVHVMLDTCIKSVSKNNKEIEVVLSPRPLKPGETEAALVCNFLPEHEKRISADLLLWAGGVRATPLLSQCALPVDRKGRMEVDEYLRVKNFNNVFAIGDDATLIDPKDQKPVPATAQAAIEQGNLVAENIARLIKGGISASVATEAEIPNVALRAYRFHEFPAIVPLGGHDGVACVGGRIFTGLPTWFLRKAADYRYLASILGWLRAVRLYISR